MIGQRNVFAPKHSAFMWTRYNLPTSVWGTTIGVSLGLSYESERFTNANPSTQVTLPSYTRADLGFYFEKPEYRLALNIENLFDEQYYTGGATDIRIYPGDPRKVSLTVNTFF